MAVFHRCTGGASGAIAVKRPRIPVKVRLAVLERQAFPDRRKPTNGLEWYKLSCHGHSPTKKVKWLLRFLFGNEPYEIDHDPALVLRKRNRVTGKLIPDANNPKYLVYRHKDEHLQKTVGRKPGAERTITSKGSDVWLAKKFRRLEGPPRRKRKIPSRPFPKWSSSARPAGKGS